MNYCGSCYFFQPGGKCLKDNWKFVTTGSVACKEYMEFKPCSHFKIGKPRRFDKRGNEVVD